MKNTVLAAAIAAALSLTAADASAAAKAPTAADVQAMQAQLQALAERLDKLEASNAQLRAENEQLKADSDRRDAETDYLKAQTKDLRAGAANADNEISKVKGADWASKIKARGDFRYRDEQFWNQERVVGTGAAAHVEDASDRSRDRIRARFGFDYKITDGVTGALQLATGGNDPRSTNQTLGTSQTGRQSIGLDLAYVDWRVTNGVNLVLGKQPYPFWRPGTSMLFDGDITPEGAAVRFERGMLFGSAYGWWLTENYNADPARNNADASVFGAQVGLKFPWLGGETRLAAQYYDCGACQHHSPLYANIANGNTTYTVAGSAANLLAYDYNILELSAEVGTTLLNQPFSVWADWLDNTASGVEYHTAWAAGVNLGKASNAKTWQAGLWYQDVQKDAQFGQFVDSDFGNGNTDTRGWVVRGTYAPVKNFNLMATWYINELYNDVAAYNSGPYHVGNNLSYDRLQLDLNYKF